jgi:hypothetical protein
MARAANLDGLGVGAILVVTGVGLGVLGLFSLDPEFALLLALLPVMWGGLLALVCASNLRRSRASTERA